MKMRRSLTWFVAWMLLLGSAFLPSAALAEPDSSAVRQRWVSRWGHPAGQSASPRDMVLSPDGSQVFVLGDGSGYGWGTSVLLAYEVASGNEEWIMGHATPMEDVRLTTLAVSPDGTRVFATGSTGFSSYSRYVTIAYDTKSGAKMWIAEYEGPWTGERNQNRASLITVSADGSKVFVAGRHVGVAGTGFDVVTIALDAHNGTQLWEARYEGGFGGIDEATGVALSPDGSRLLVTGFSRQSTSPSSIRHSVVIAYDSVSGAQVWVTRSERPWTSADSASSPSVSPDGNRLFVSGGIDEGTDSEDAWTRAFDVSSGALIWETRSDGAPGTGGIGRSTAMSPGSKLFVTRVTGPGVRVPPGAPVSSCSTTCHTETVAYEAGSGSRLWTAHFDVSSDKPIPPASSNVKPGFTIPSGLAVSPDGGTLYLGGSSSSAALGGTVSLGGSSYGVPSMSVNTGGYAVAYDAASGAEVWRVQSQTATISPSNVSSAAEFPLFYSDYPSYKAVKRLPDSALYGRTFEMSPDGSMVFLAGSGERFQRVHLHDAANVHQGRIVTVAYCTSLDPLACRGGLGGTG